jgi:hypothetical protein
MSSDIRELLHDAVDSPMDSGFEFDAVLRRSRELRRTRRATFFVAGALAVGAAAGLLWLVSTVGFPFPHGLRPAATGSPPRSRSFPGGGQILYEQAGALRWAKPGGPSQLIARNFSGARPFPDNGSKLLAWRLTGSGYDYYVLNADGSHRIHVLAPRATRSDVPRSYDDVVVSPDGERLAYLHPRADGGVSTKAPYELEVKDISSGNVTDLGPAGPFSNCCYHVAWSDNSVLLMQSSSGRFIGWVNISTGSRGTYLRVNDPRFRKAYEQAWPGAGSPQQISPIGQSPDAYVSEFAVLVSGPDDTKQAVVILTNHGVHGFAPRDGEPQLSFVWASLGGRFALLSYHSASGGRSGYLYLGNGSRSKLTRLGSTTGLIAGPFLDYDGSWMLVDEQQTWRFISLIARRTCSDSASCRLKVHSVTFSNRSGLPMGWE